MKLKRILIPLVLLIISATIFIYSTSVVSARLTSRLTVTENMVMPTTSVTAEINGLDEIINYSNGSTRYDVDHLYADTVKNDGILNLAALTNSLGEVLNLTDEVVVAAKFFLQDDAGASVVISNGVSNSYPLFGTTYSFTLQANQSLLFKADTVLIPVSSAARTITYNSSNDSTLLYIMILTADSYN